MGSLLAAAIFFLGIHFTISGSALRDKIVTSIAQGPYVRAAFLEIKESVENRERVKRRPVE